MQQLRILYQDEVLVAVDKPAGLMVHPSAGYKGDAKTVLKLLKSQLDKWVYPIHRLDRGTSGVLLFALSSEAAGKMQNQFKVQSIQKTYVTLIRGWAESQGEIISPLGGVAAHTVYETLYQFELPRAVSSRYSTSRYSLLKVSPRTGRFHQIRKHFKHLSHPVIGDTIYGDGKHNQLFRELTKEKGLYLKAYSLKFQHPLTGESIYLHSRWNRFWHRLFDVAGFCPLILSEPSVCHPESGALQFPHENRESPSR